MDAAQMPLFSSVGIHKWLNVNVMNILDGKMKITDISTRTNKKLLKEICLEQ
jgi:hypothetical protein